jgi:hypothetical protein
MSLSLVSLEELNIRSPSRGLVDCDAGYSPGWGLEHRVSNPVSVKNLTAIETSTIVKLLRPYGPVGTKRTSK